MKRPVTSLISKYRKEILLSLILLVSILAYAGRIFDINLLHGVFFYYKPLSQQGATCFILLTSAVFGYLHLRGRYSSMIWSVLLLPAFILSGSVLGYHLFHYQLNIENVFRSSYWSMVPALSGRMSPVTALLFVLSILSFFIHSLSHNKALQAISKITALLIGAYSFLLIVAYFYRAPLFYTNKMVPVSFISSLSFFILSIVLIDIYKINFIPVRFKQQSMVSSQLIQAFLPIALILIIIHGFIRANLNCSMVNPAITDVLLLFVAIAVSIVVIFQLSKRIGRSIEQAEAEKLRIRDELEESNKKFSLIFYNSQEAIGASYQGVHLYVNPAYLKLFGYTEKELVGRPILDLIADEEKERVQKIREDRLKGISFLTKYETKGKRKDGSVFDFEVSTSEFNFQGSIHSIVLIRDITQEKKTQEIIRQNHAELASQNQEYLTLFEEYKVINEELSEKNDTLVETNLKLSVSEEQYRSLFDNMLNGFALCRMLFDDRKQPVDFIYLKVNKAFETLTGLKDVVGKHVSQVIPGIRESDQKIFDVYGRVALTGNPEFLETYVEALQMWFSISVFSPDLEYFVAVFDVITERKQAEEALKESEKKFRDLFEFSPVGKSMTAIDGSFYVNKAFCNILGYSEEELKAKTWIDITHPEDIQRTAEIVQSLKDGKSPQIRFEKRYLHKNGNVIWTDVSSYMQRDKAGKPQFFITSISDITERKQTEEKLQASEQKLKLFVEYAPAAIAMYDRDMRYIAASRRFFTDYRLTVHDIIGRSHYDIFPEVPERWKEIHRNCLAGATEKAEEDPFLRADGTMDWIRWEIHPWFEKSGQIGGLLLFSEVITQRKLAEKALMLSEKKYRHLFDNNPQFMWIYDLETLAFLEVNQAAIEHYGYSREEFLKMTVRDIHPKEDQNLLTRVITNGPSRTSETRHIKKNGDMIIVEIISHEIEFESKKARLVLSNDITERKKAEKLIKTLSKAIEQSPSSIIITNAEGKIDFVNTKFTSFMQYQLKDVKGRNSRIFNPGHCSPEDFEGMWRTIRDGNTWQGESKNRKKDGTEFWENVIVSPLLDDNGQISNFIVITEDITEKKKMLDDLISAKEKAEEGDRLKTAFLHNISHEIRTPMNAIIGFSGFLNDSQLPSEKRQHFADIIVKSSNQLLSIITDIINIATIEAGQGKIQEQEINLNAVIRLIHEQFILKAQKQHILLRYSTLLPDQEADILTDDIKLTEILANLVGNAIKFTEQGFVSFGYDLKADYLEFYVEDTGMGIPPNMLDEIFKRFRQVEVTENRKFGGSGLGLSISKAYAEILGGKIWVTSEPGKGSIFYFTIPYKKAKPEPISSIQQAFEQGINLKDSKTLLIAEDEDSNFILLKEFLSGTGFTIIRAKNGSEAVSLCMSNPKIDLVLMDIKMPEMDGYEATKRIKEFRPGLPVIAQTAYTYETDINKVLACGCTDFINKPIRRDLLLSKINEILSAR
jgi:PAS domain S-box-containing protein